MAAEACDPSTAEVEAESGVQSQPLVYNIQDPVTNKQKKRNNITFSFSTSVHTVIVPCYNLRFSRVGSHCELIAKCRLHSYIHVDPEDSPNLLGHWSFARI